MGDGAWTPYPGWEHHEPEREREMDEQRIAELEAQVRRLQQYAAFWHGCADAYYVDRAESLGCPLLQPGDMDDS